MRLAVAISVLLLSSLVLLVASCSDTPVATEAQIETGAGVDTDAELEALLLQTPASSADDRVRDRAGALDHLIGFALHRIEAEQGPEVVERITHHLHELTARVQHAHEAGDEARFTAAVEALATTKAQVVVRVLGPRVTQRVLHHAVERIHRIQARIGAAEGTDRDVSHARRIVAAASALVRRGRGALSSGDPARGLLFGARALDVLRAID